jgi:hypothetical protein
MIAPPARGDRLMLAVQFINRTWYGPSVGGGSRPPPGSSTKSNNRKLATLNAFPPST